MRYFRILTLLVLFLTAAVFGYNKLVIESKIDRVSPVIEMETEEIEVSVNATDEELLVGLTADDDRDGDVTDSLVVESMGKFTEKGKCIVSYAAFDKSGNVGKATRVVRYTDYISPRFSIVSPLRIRKGDYTTSLFSNVTASDCIDGNLTGFIKFKTGEDSYYNIEGDVLLAIQVTNSKGDTSKIEIYGEALDEKEYAKPYPSLEEYLVYTGVGEKVNTRKLLQGVVRNNSLFAFDDEDNERYDRSMVKISEQEVDYNTPGVYRVVYSLYSDEKNEEEVSLQGHAYLYIVVEK